MAIVIAPDDTLQANVRVLRPALEFSSGKLFLGDGDVSPWRELMLARHEVIERAALGVARIETKDKAFPWMGTAFVVSERVAITAAHAAKAFAPKLVGAIVEGQRSASLNFDPSDAKARVVPIRAVREVHPYWGFAFLDLGEAVEPHRILKVSEPRRATDVAGTDKPPRHEHRI